MLLSVNMRVFVADRRLQVGCFGIDFIRVYVHEQINEDVILSLVGDAHFYFRVLRQTKQSNDFW